MPIYAYLRVSTVKQDLANQKLAILEFAQTRRLQVDEFIELEMSSRKTMKERRVDELLGRLEEGDTLIVSELSRLARSLGQVVQAVDAIMEKGVRLLVLKQGLDLKGKHDMTSKMQVAIFGLLADLERDLISERTKMGLARAREEGKRLGRPKGSLGKSKLDGKEAEIARLLKLRVPKASIARIVGCSWPTLKDFIVSRGVTAA